MVLVKELLKDKSSGGFIAEVACPHCGSVVSGNVPATPERRIVGYIRHYETGVHSANKCMACRETFFIHRYSDSSWVVRRNSDGAIKA